MLAIIPARGGSKGLPGKNIRLFCGEPLIAHTIKTALESNSITQVVVSTDDLEISKISEAYGANVPFLRPSHLSQDDSLAKDAYLYTIDRLIEIYPQNDYSSFIVLLPTAPLRTSQDIDAAVSIFAKKKADSVVSYAELPHPIQWSTRIGDDGRFLDLRNDLKNRQDYEPYYFPVGCVYVFKYELLKKGLYYSANSFAYVLPKDKAVEIDTVEDFLYAEVLFNQRKNK